MAGLSAADLLKWRWLCATGVYHASGNTLSPEVLDELVRINTGAEEFLCKHSNLWGKYDRYFGRCAAGLGIKETEHRLIQVKNGECMARSTADGKQMAPAPWEMRQLEQARPRPACVCDVQLNGALSTTNTHVVHVSCVAPPLMSML
jgi:hypothetical protein